MKYLLLGLLAFLALGAVTITVRSPGHGASVDLQASGRVEFVGTVRSNGVPLRDIEATIFVPPFEYADDPTAIWCVTGPNHPMYGGCEIFDLDTNGTVDLRDWTLRTTADPAVRASARAVRSTPTLANEAPASLTLPSDVSGRVGAPVETTP